MGFAQPSRERSGPALPLASMVDVLFLLLIFFMTTSMFRDQDVRIDVDLEEAGSATAAQPTVPPLIVTVDPDNQLYIGPRRYSMEQLEATIASLAESGAVEMLVLRGDRVSDLGVATRIMEAARAAGIEQVAIAAREAAPGDN